MRADGGLRDDAVVEPSPSRSRRAKLPRGRREWAPAVGASGVERPARIYDLRSTFASNALAGGVAVFELAGIMGTSVRMIELHYGTLLDGARSAIAGRLDGLEAELEQAAEASSGDV